MDLYELDYLAVSGQSWLHRLPAGVKLLALAGVLAVVLSIHSLPLYAGVLAVVLLLAASARLPLLTLIALTLYPLVFLAMLMISIEHLTVLSAATLAMRVLASTASIILVLLTTSYPAIFGALGRVLPGSWRRCSLRIARCSSLTALLSIRASPSICAAG